MTIPVTGKVPVTVGEVSFPSQEILTLNVNLGQSKKKKGRNVEEEAEQLLSLCCYEAQQTAAADLQAPQLLYNQKSNRLAVTTSDNRHYAVDEELRPFLLRYLATTSCVVQQEQVMAKSSSMEVLHSRIAEELQVFFDSVIAILILDPSSATLHPQQYHDYVCLSLRNAMMTDTLFPVINSSDPLPTKLEKLDQCVDAASISSKVTNQLSYVMLLY